MIHARIEQFEVYHQETLLRGERWRCENPKNTILILHGAGNSSRCGFNRLQNHLLQHNYETVTFDFLGHGETGGNIQHSSLDKRTKQALSVISALELHNELNIIGFSMGAHNALHITTQVPVRRLGLVIPAVYSPEAEFMAFGPSFTSCIRRNNSWKDSDCFSIIRNFKGKLLIISAENDRIIPADIPCRLLERANQCSEAEHHCIRQAGHDLSTYFSDHPACRNMALNSILRLLE